MPSRETLPFISEADASGEVAALYAEIRDTLGVPVVNLIWRHFATIDGGLPWAWKTLAPLYTSGAAHRAGAQLVAGLSLPRLSTIPAAVLTGAGVSDRDRPVLAAILDSYNRGNALNICALSALAATPERAAPAAPAARAVAELPRPATPIPGVGSLGDFPPPVQGLVWEMNRLGDPRPAGDAVLATLYKHLAPWPGYLCLAWGLLAPLHGNELLSVLARDAVAAARTEGASLSHLKASVAPPAASRAVVDAASHFVDHVIGRMIPIAQLLRRALPEPDLAL